MKVLYQIVCMFILMLLFSCSEHNCADEMADTVFFELQDTISFPIDENTFYASKAMFQFEEEGREFLFFQNRRDKGRLHLKYLI